MAGWARGSLLVALAAALVVGCAQGRRGRPATGRDGGATLDGSPPAMDGEVPDGGPRDALPPPTDAPPFDGGPGDSGPTDAGPADAGPIDAGWDSGPPDSGPIDSGPIDSGPVVGSTFDFPAAGDMRFTSATNFWNAGDYVQGTRTTSLPSVARATIHLGIPTNALTCDTQDVRFTINGTTVGMFYVMGGATAVDQSFTFPAITGPTYTLRYETSRTVAPGCGSADYAFTGSTVTLSP